MKKFTKLFSLILIFSLILSIFPAVKADAAEKKYKLALTGEYDLGDDEKVIYNYSKMMKNIKLEKVEGKNQWNLKICVGAMVKRMCWKGDGCMVLSVCRDKSTMPEELFPMFVESNDRFFSAYGSIEDTPEVRRILKDIEHAEYL